MCLVVLPHREEPAISEGHAHCVLPAFQMPGHIMRVIQHRLTIIRRIGCQHLVSHPASVDVQLIQSHPGDVQGGAADTAFQCKLTTQITGGKS